MSAQPRPAAAPAAPGGKGCLGKGCLTFLVVLLALAIFSVGAWKRWGRAYVQGRLAQLREQQPLVALGLDLLPLKLGGADGSAAAPLEAVRGRQPGTTDHSAVPADLPLFENPVAEAFSVGAEQVTAYQRVARPAAQAGAQVERGMAAAGWRPSTRSGRPGSSLTVFKKGERSCVVEIEERLPDTEVFTRCQR